MSNVLVKLARQHILRLLDGQRVQVPTSVGLLEVEAKADDRWQPLKRHATTKEVADKLAQAKIDMPDLIPDEVWSNDIYEVFVHRSEEGGAHLSIKRYDRAAVHNWRHFQQIKNEVCGPFFEAVELYPSETRVADNANQYHLWVMPEGVILELGFSGGMVLVDDDEVERYNTNGDKGRQEPMQPGLTVGEGMNEHQKSLSPEDDAARRRIVEGGLA